MALRWNVFAGVLTEIYFQGACKAKLNGIKDELKHIDREIRQIQPELRKVRLTSHEYAMRTYE